MNTQEQASFKEIGEALGISAVRAHQIYQQAMKKAGERTLNINEILEALAEHQPEESFHEVMTDQMFVPDDSDNLRGFWNEAEANK